MGCRISTPTQVERVSMDSSTENLIEQYENTVRQSTDRTDYYYQRYFIE